MKTKVFLTFLIITIYSFFIFSCNSLSDQENKPPSISSITSNPTMVLIQGTTQLHCEASDPDVNNLDYNWDSEHGTIVGTGSTVSWNAPNSIGVYTIYCTVYDGIGGEDNDSIKVPVYSIVEQIFVVDSRSGLISFGGIGLYDTEFYVKEGDSLIIESNGGFFNGIVDVPDPNGFAGLPDPRYPPMLPNIASNSLIGSIGSSFSGDALLDDALDIHPKTEETGSELGYPGLFGPGFVGTSFSVRISSTSVGKIYFAINDWPLADNSDNITINVKKLVFTD